MLNGNKLGQLYLPELTFAVTKEHGLNYLWWSIEETNALKIPLSKTELRKYALSKWIDLERESIIHTAIKQGFDLYDIDSIYINFTNTAFKLKYDY